MWYVLPCLRLIFYGYKQADKASCNCEMCLSLWCRLFFINLFQDWTVGKKWQCYLCVFRKDLKTACSGFFLAFSTFLLLSLIHTSCLFGTGFGNLSAVVNAKIVNVLTRLSLLRMKAKVSFCRVARVAHVRRGHLEKKIKPLYEHVILYGT